MSKGYHPHAAALDRLGYAPVKEHFNVTRRTWQYWRVNGVPVMHRKTIALMGAIAGLDMAEVRDDCAPRERSAA